MDDFYADWARAEFGPKAAEPAAAIFTRLDGHLPRPADWVTGPGSISPDPRPWEQVRKEYAFVDEMEALRPLVEGPGNLERYQYWLDNFRYLRSIAEVRCVWARFNAAMEKVKAEKNPDAQKRLARELALPIRKKLVAAFAELHRHLLATVSDPGEMGNVCNWQQQIMPVVLTAPGEELAKLLGMKLPADAMPSKQYAGPPRIFVREVRTGIVAGETLKLTVIVMGPKPESPKLYWRPLGTGNFASMPLGTRRPRRLHGHAAGRCRQGRFRVLYSSSGRRADDSVPARRGRAAANRGGGISLPSPFGRGAGVRAVSATLVLALTLTLSHWERGPNYASSQFAHPVSRGAPGGLVSPAGADNPYARVLAGAMTIIENRALDPVGDKKLFEGAMYGMLSQFDENTTYLSPKDLATFNEALDLQFAGIGMTMIVDPKTKQLVVGSPVANSPAARAGIRRRRQNPADRQDQHPRNVAARTLPCCCAASRTRRSRSPCSTRAPRKPVEIPLVRENIQGESVLGDTCNPDGSWNYFLEGHDRIGYLRVSCFTDQTADELRKAVEWLKAQGMRGLVLDLRDDPGGYLPAAVAVCNLFIRTGEIVTTRGRGGIVGDSYPADGDAPFTDFPMAVIVNQDTASAAEIVAACLQDHRRAAVVGQRTYGKGTVQDLIDLEPGCGGMKLTTKSYWRPSGKDIRRPPDATGQGRLGRLARRRLQGRARPGRVQSLAGLAKQPRPAPAHARRARRQERRQALRRSPAAAGGRVRREGSGTAENAVIGARAFRPHFVLGRDPAFPIAVCHCLEQAVPGQRVTPPHCFCEAVAHWWLSRRDFVRQPRVAAAATLGEKYDNAFTPKGSRNGGAAIRNPFRVHGIGGLVTQGSRSAALRGNPGLPYESPSG